MFWHKHYPYLSDLEGTITRKPSFSCELRNGIWGYHDMESNRGGLYTLQQEWSFFGSYSCLTVKRSIWCSIRGEFWNCGDHRQPEKGVDVRKIRLESQDPVRCSPDPPSPQDGGRGKSQRLLQQS